MMYHNPDNVAAMGQIMSDGLRILPSSTRETATAAIAVTATIVANQLESLRLTDFARATTPEQWRHSQKQERLSQAENAAIASGHNQNMQNNNSDGSGDPKRSPQTNIGKVVLGTGIGTAIGVQVTNPDPSKDANQAKMEQRQQQQNQNQNQHQNNNQQENKPIWQLW